jgi:F-type H+-transporting ATPase subunit c
MTKTKFLLLLAFLMIASPMLFGQAADPADTNQVAQQHAQWKGLAAGLSMAIASGLCALGQGKAVAGATEAMARNPGATAAIRFALLLGLVLIESLALYTFAIVFMKIG